MKINLVIILLICTIQMFYSQEDNGVVALALPVRNSLMFNQYTINPTFSFVRQQHKYISFTNKREWVQFENAPETNIFSYSGRFAENIGAGIGLFQQNFGVFTTFGGVANFAYNVQLSADSNLTFGLNVGAYNSGLNNGNVITNVPDPSVNTIPSNFLLTVNPGINYGLEFLDFGVSLNNLAVYNFNSSELLEDNPEQSLQAHVMYTGYMDNFGFLAESKFTGLVRSEFKQDQTVVSGIAMLLVPKGIWAQVGYNSLYGASAGVGLYITKQIAIEYNYEKAVGDLTDFGPSHEISLAYKLNNFKNYNYSREDEVSTLFTGNKKRKPAIKKVPSKTQVAVNKETKTEAEKIETTKSETDKTLEQELIAKEAAEVQAKIDAENKAKAKAEEQKKLEAEEKARIIQEARIKAAAQEKAAEAQAKQEADAKAKAIEEARLAAEAQAKQEAEAKANAIEEARLVAETQAKQEADAKAKAIEEARLAAQVKAKAEAEEQAKREIEAQLQAKEAAALEQEQKAQEAATAKAKMEAEEVQTQLKAQDTVVTAVSDKLGTGLPKDMEDSMKAIEKLTEDSDVLLARFQAAVNIKDKDLKDLKLENDLGDQGIYSEPKPFKSVTEENNAIEAIKVDLMAVIESREKRIEELEQLYDKNIKLATMVNDTVLLSYQKTITKLKSEQSKAIQTKDILTASLAEINTATEFERKRRIKRAAYTNEEDRYVQDRAILERIKQNTALSTTPLKEADFDFGEEQSGNIQILKNVNKVDEGYYLIVAVHRDAAKRDEFVRKAVASGETNIDFFYSVNTSKYYIYYKKFNTIEEANEALKSKGSKPVNSKLSIVKTEN